jgi:hypothetical protein
MLPESARRLRLFLYFTAALGLAAIAVNADSGWGFGTSFALALLAEIAFWLELFGEKREPVAVSTRS